MKMEFRTLIDLPKAQLDITHSDKILLLGSCFAENIGKLLQVYKFDCDVNPFGILYNPKSVLQALREIKSGKVYKKEELYHHKDIYHSFMHHGSFSDASGETVIENINQRLCNANKNFPHTSLLMITFGSAYVYSLKTDGCVVANCHKLPDSFFVRSLLTIDDIVSEYADFLKSLFITNPGLRVLMTVSPIRHLKDGLHNNQISKSVLLLSINRLQQLFPDNVFYFPSYEIMLDDLRDYRFYADDMLHPSNIAIEYLWSRFNESYFSSSTLKILKEWEEIRKGLNHRPFRADSEQYKSFLKQLVLKIERVKEKCPNLDVKNELELCRTLLMR